MLSNETISSGSRFQGVVGGECLNLLSLCSKGLPL